MRRTFFSLMFCLAFVVLQAQPSSSALDSLKSFVVNINSFNKLNPQEKVFLHFDNTSYFLNETIWFKAYVVRADDLQLTQISKVLYVELLTDNGICIATKKLKIENGQCHGNFHLKPERQAGFYEIRAYTRSMLNFDEACLFSRVFPLYNQPQLEGDYSQKDMKTNYDNQQPENMRKTKAAKKAQKALERINIDFYPEGGHIVKGMNNHIAFRATDKEGRNISVTGKVKDANGNEVSNFTTIHQGMGMFLLSPTEDSYKVEITYEKKTDVFDLPEISPSGYVMTVNNMKENTLDIRISKTPNIPIEPLGMTITCRGKLSIFNALSVKSDVLQIPVAKDALSTGINCITIFRSTGEILSERLFFVNHPSGISLSCTSDKNTFNPLEKIHIGIEAKNDSGLPISTHISLSVRDAASSGVSVYPDDIRTNLLLSSDLKGYIEEPGYYFSSDDLEHSYALDLLMMTQGWRRYSWKQMAGLKPFEVQHPIEESLMIKGQVLKPIKDEPIKKAHLKYTLSKEGFPNHIAYGHVDNDGQFAFLLDDSLDIQNQWELTLSVPRGKKEAHRNRILLDRHFSPTPKPYAYNETVDMDNYSILEEKKETKHRSIEEIQLIKEVKVSRYKSYLEKPNIIYDVDKEINELADRGIYSSRNVGGYLEDRNLSITYVDMGDCGSYYLYDDRLIRFYRVDSGNIYTRRTHIADNTNLQSVEKIEVYLHVNSLVKHFLIPINDILHGEDYVYAVVYIKPDKSYKYVSKGIRLTHFDGYSNCKEFAKTVLHKPIFGEIDHRRTIYWNPNLMLDSLGKGAIEFYNNSSYHHILIEAQGMSNKGIPIEGKNY